MITQEFNLNLHAGHSIPLVINVSQYEKNEQWVFTLFNSDGTQYRPASASIVGTKSDGNLINNEATVDSDGRVVVEVTDQIAAAAGKAVFELRLDNQTHGTANFVVLVEKSPADEGIPSESDLSLFQEAINSIAIAGSGAPAVATTASEMIDTGKIYLYAGSETGYTAGDWYYYNGSAWVDGGKYGGTVDSTLTIPGAAADAKKTGDEISELKSQITNGLPRDVKLALNTILQGIPFIDDDVYSDELAVFNAWATAVSIVGISAVFDQGDNIILSLDSLDSLKQYLTVTAEFDDGSTTPITTYTLSGDLTGGGECTITASYDGKSTTFTANVIEAVDVTPSLSSFTAEPKCAISVDSANNSIRVYTTANTVYSGARADMPSALKEGYTYKVSADVTVTKGTANGGIATKTNDSLMFTIGAKTASGYYEKADIPSTKSNWNTSAQIRLLCTWATNGQGDVTFTNFKVIEYLIPEGE